MWLILLSRRVDYWDFDPFHLPQDSSIPCNGSIRPAERA